MEKKTGTNSLVRTNYLSWLRPPVVTLPVSTEAGHPPAFGEGQHRGGALPGIGNRNGKGPGGGKGLGPGKGGGPEGLHAVAPANVLRTVASYASFLLWFAVLTAAIEAGIHKRCSCAGRSVR